MSRYELVEFGAIYPRCGVARNLRWNKGDLAEAVRTLDGAVTGVKRGAS